MAKTTIIKAKVSQVQVTHKSAPYTCYDLWCIDEKSHKPRFVDEFATTELAEAYARKERKLLGPVIVHIEIPSVEY